MHASFSHIYNLGANKPWQAEPGGAISGSLCWGEKHLVAIEVPQNSWLGGLTFSFFQPARSIGFAVGRLIRTDRPWGSWAKVHGTTGHVTWLVAWTKWRASPKRQKHNGNKNDLKMLEDSMEFVDFIRMLVQFLDLLAGPPGKEFQSGAKVHPLSHWGQKLSGAWFQRHVFEFDDLQPTAWGLLIDSTGFLKFHHGCCLKTDLFKHVFHCVPIGFPLDKYS